MSTALSTLPDAWTMFPESEQPRVRETHRRYALLTEAADDFIEAHIRQYVGARAESWGPPDTSRNALVAICTSMSTPGHYGRTPSLHGDGATSVEPLLDGLWPLKQHVQYLAFGLGACATLSLAPASLGRITHAVVPPQDLWVTSHPDDEREPVIVRQLRVRYRVDRRSGQRVAFFAWDVWDCSDVDAPAFLVTEARAGGVYGEDVTAEVGLGPLLGEDYPCRYPDGTPFVPYTIQRAREDGTLWAWHRGRGAVRGTANAMLLQTYALKSARDCTGDSHIVSGVHLQGVRQQAGAEGVATLDVEPGSVIFGRHEPGTQPFAYAFGSGGHLEQIAAYAKSYVEQLAVDLGVTPTDAVRAGSNPMSGVALYLTNAAKREEQLRQEPLCRAADLATIRKVVALALGAGQLDADPGPVGISYHEIKPAPDELKDAREALEWEASQGLASPVDLYLARRPGLTREQAVAELARIQREQAAINGLAAPTVPPATAAN